MVVLKKIKSATLVEALVATAIVVIIFVIASLVLNNLVLNTFSKKTYEIEYRLNELEYELQNHAIRVPYEENYIGWHISIVKDETTPLGGLDIMAVQEKTQKVLSRKRVYE